MFPEWLEFREEYAAVFMSEEQRGTAAKSLPAPEQVQMWSFGSPQLAVAVAVGGQHPEPVIDWLRASHAVTRGRSMLAAVLKSGRATPSETDSYMFVCRIAELTTTVLSHLLSSDRFCLFLPHTNEILVLTSPSDGLGLVSDISILPSPQTGFVLQCHTSVKAKIRRRVGRQYDPIDSQITEVLGSVSQMALDSAGALIDEWRTTMKADPPGILLEQPKRIASKRKELEQASRDTEHGDPVLLAEVDYHARDMQRVLRAARRIRGALRDYRLAGVDTLQHESRTYDEIAGPLVLRAAANYAGDVARRFALGRDVSFLASLGESYVLRPLQQTLFERTSWRHESTFILEIPLENRMRLGSLPVIAHEVAHILLEGRSSDLVTRLIDIWIDDAELRFLFEPVLRRENSRRPEVWAAEIAADLLATIAIGVPYIYAMVRFSIGTLRDFSDRVPGDGLFPPFPTRLRACLALLRTQGQPVPFTSKYLEATSDLLPREFVEELSALVVDRLDESNFSAIAADLRNGRVPDARPTEIVGVVWDAVVRRSGYLHEIAALLGISGSID